MDAIEVQSDDAVGFAVGLYCDGDEVVVSGGAWHKHFSDAEDALNCAAFLLSDRCRLKTVYRGTTVTSCKLQSLEDGEWIDDSVVGFFLFPFWKPKRVEYQQNTVITGKD